MQVMGIVFSTGKCNYIVIHASLGKNSVVSLLAVCIINKYCIWVAFPLSFPWSIHYCWRGTDMETEFLFLKSLMCSFLHSLLEMMQASTGDCLPVAESNFSECEAGEEPQWLLVQMNTNLPLA